MPLELWYFPLHGRALAPLLTAAVAKLDVEFRSPDNWQEMKNSTPFGQLPVLKDGNQQIAQSGAIIRYLAHKGKLLGNDDHDAVVSDVLLQEAEDLYMGLARSKHDPKDPLAAFTKYFGETLPKQVHYLDRLLKGTDQFTKTVTVGEIGLFAVLYQAVNVHSNALAGTQTEVFFKRLQQQSEIAAFLTNTTLRHYFVAPEGWVAPSKPQLAELPAIKAIGNGGEGFNIVYFDILARGFLPGLAAEFGNHPYSYSAGDWPADKEFCPFGQLPVMNADGLVIAQSLAIARFVGRKVGLLADGNDADFAISEALLQEGEDLYVGLAKTKYGDGNYEGFAKGTLATQIQFLERLLLPSGDRFTNQGNSLGELALYSTLKLVTIAYEAAVQGSKIEAFYNRLNNDDGTKRYFAKHPPKPYFK